MTSNRPLGIAVWGLGSHARRKLVPALGHCCRARLAGVVSRNQVVAAEVAAAAGCIAWPDADAMLADPAVDVVYLSTPTGLHHEHGARALAAGKHLWCEKSLTDSAERSRALVDAARSTGRSLYETFMYRDHPQFERLAGMVAAGELGAIRSLSCRFGIPHQPPGDFRYSAALGGGGLLDMGCYGVDISLALLGAPLDVVASGRRRPAGFEVDIDGWALLRAGSGARALIEWGYGASYRNELLVWGESQSVFADRIFSKPPDLETSLVVADATGTPRAEPIPAANAFTRMIDRLADCLDDSDARESHLRQIEHQSAVMSAIAAGPIDH